MYLSSGATPPPPPPEDWLQTGSGLTINNVGIAVGLKPLTSSRVAFSFKHVISGDIELHVYDFDGASWSKTGNTLVLTGTSNLALAALSSSRVALVFNPGTGTELRTYDFDGVNWAQVGNSLAINIIPGGLGGMSASRVAAVVGTRVQAHNFDGVNWAPQGSTKSVLDSFEMDTLGVSSTRIFTSVGGSVVTNGTLRAWDFNGTFWSLDINTGHLFNNRNPALALLSPTKVAYIDDTYGNLETYNVGTSFVQTGNGLNISGVARPELAGLSSSRVAFFDTGNNRLRTYDFV